MIKNREQLVITDTIETSGSISYWRIASDTNLSTLKAAWEKHGLVADQLPKAPKDEVALGRAVNSMTEKRVLVRPLARRGAWGIVQETATEQGAGLPPKLTHETLVYVFFREGHAVVEQAMGTWAQRNEYAVRIDAAYASARNTLAHHDISSWLLDIAYKLDAVSLRDSGGIYFIPRTNVSIWDKVANAIEATGSSIFRIPAMRTAEAVAAITDAITAEAAAMAQKIEDELLATGDATLGARALKTRVAESMKLLEKIGSYEALIGKQLEIRQRVELLSANVSAAALTSETSTEST